MTQQILSQLYTLKTLKCVRWETNERVTGRKAKGPQAVGGNKLQVAWFFFFFLYTKFKKASFDNNWFCLNFSQTLILPMHFSSAVLMKLCICFGICLSSKWLYLRLIFFFLFLSLGLIMAQQISILVNCYMAGDDTPHAILSQKCILWEKLVKLLQPWAVSLFWLGAC